MSGAPADVTRTADAAPDGQRGPAPPRGLVVAALALPTLATAAVALPDPHWCFLPIWACGVVTVGQTCREVWSAGTLLRSASAVWATLVHLTFVAPLLHLRLDFWMRLAALPEDMRPWMGYLGGLTLAGLLLMLASQRLGHRHGAAILEPREIRRRAFLVIAFVALAASLASAVHVHRSFGGFGGFVAAFERGLDSFTGWGPPIVIAGMAPTLAAALVLGLFRDRLRAARLGPPLLAAFVVALFIFAGLAGSRSNVLLGVLWAVIVWHRMVRPVRWRTLWLLAAAGLTFLFVLGFYKAGGRQAIRDALSPETARATVARTDRSLPMLILLDLGRYDVQSLLLERYHGPGRWDLGMGRTYIAGLLSPIPRRLFPGKPDLKVREGTDALMGPGSFERTGRAATNQYGLAGEAVLNFGPLAIPIAYAVFGLLFGFVSRLEDGLDPSDPRWILLGFAPPILARTLMVDSDNLVLLLLQSYLLLAPMMLLGSRRARGPDRVG